jgi:hypothetical protein
MTWKDFKGKWSWLNPGIYMMGMGKISENPQESITALKFFKFFILLLYITTLFFPLNKEPMAVQFKFLVSIKGPIKI